MKKTMTAGEAVRAAAKQVQATGVDCPFIRHVAILAEQLAGRELDIADIHDAMRADQSAGRCVLYTCDDPQRLVKARHGSFTARVAGEDRHLVHYR